MMEVLTVKEAVERVNSGGNLEGVILDENTIQQVNVRDAMVLSRGGIVNLIVPAILPKYQKKNDRK